MTLTHQWIERRLPRVENRDGDHRSPFQRDKARILHSAAFRRLQAKTQVLGVGIGDFYRTRLTHSLEAAQIGVGICAQLNAKYAAACAAVELDANLIEALCLAHDIGHPPFGHGGEIALNVMMHDAGGFEGNGQTFRIVSKLEPYTEHHGMNLSRRTVLGLVKYPNFIEELRVTNKSTDTNLHSLRQIRAGDWHPAKGLFTCDKDIFDWLLAPFSAHDRQKFIRHSGDDATITPTQHHRTLHKSVDCSIMELADDIAYGVHDLEDSIVMGMVNETEFRRWVSQPIQTMQVPWLSDHIEPLTVKLFSDQHYERKNAIGALVNTFITAITLSQQHQFEHPLLDHQAQMPQAHQQALSIFKRFVFNKVIQKPEIQLLEYKGQQVVMELFQAFSSDPERLLPDNTRVRWGDAQENNLGARVIADYISGMTDEFASRLYSNMFIPKRGGTHDTLSL
ncbi:anti-phage deoxyguanosine triphosphatase [Alteromonas oceanisediminis]|uniref:anti-phage deoxyguanosine triphosphatase n=1 Tax=Alteromonas oceanisediminis TaxID=2836180 RepID=UPI001BD9D092|nr:anti-phage deoxyguanosine triphosphatase [Alteromonas oceanisediminis]MBT0586422.1 deoxyguanosinetriphosphate triphosphohydrolase family protein [Alteromonas oceanisediminis]